MKNDTIYHVDTVLPYGGRVEDPASSTDGSLGCTADRAGIDCNGPVFRLQKEGTEDGTIDYEGDAACSAHLSGVLDQGVTLRAERAKRKAQERDAVQVLLDLGWTQDWTERLQPPR